MTDVNNAKEAAAEVLAVLDKAGAKQLGQILTAIYGAASEGLMTRVIEKASLDTASERPAAIVNALDRIVSEDASRYPNPLQALRRNESVDLLLNLHEVNKSLNPGIQESVAAPYYVVPLGLRSSPYHPASPFARPHI